MFRTALAIIAITLIAGAAQAADDVTSENDATVPNSPSMQKNAPQSSDSDTGELIQDLIKEFEGETSQ